MDLAAGNDSPFNLLKYQFTSNESGLHSKLMQTGIAKQILLTKL